MRVYCTLLLIFLILSVRGQESNKNVNWKNIKVLIYTKNQVGLDKKGNKYYVHENIPFAVKCLQKLGEEKGFKTEVSENPEIFTEENLKQYTLVIFPSTNNDAFNTDTQRLAFRHYIEAGGGFVGLHSVLGTERNWPWFKMMIGGTFAWHPKFQKYKIKVIDPDHPSVEGLPKVWQKEDECYFQKEMYPGIRTVMAHDLTTLNSTDSARVATTAGPLSILYPAVWYQTFDGGNIWITALGHDKKDYEDPIYVQHIFQGIQYIASQLKPKNYSKAYSKTKDDQVQY